MYLIRRFYFLLESFFVIPKNSDYDFVFPKTFVVLTRRKESPSYPNHFSNNFKKTGRRVQTDYLRSSTQKTLKWLCYAQKLIFANVEKNSSRII